jgi:hypothetical protein
VLPASIVQPPFIPDATFAPTLLTRSDDAQVRNVVTATEMPSTALLLQKKTWKASPVPGTSGNVVSANRNDGMPAYGTVECH